MTIKNILYCIFALAITGIIHILCLVIYPIAFIFRHKILKYADSKIEEDFENNVFKIKNGVKKWKLYFSPLFWGFLFTTGFTTKYCGRSWYKKEKKLKWFTVFTIDEDPHPIPITLKQKIQYFWLSYCWGGWRNAAWAFTEWFFREGRTKEIKLSKNKMQDKTLDPSIMPSTAFKDIDGSDRNNSGPYIKYTFDTENKWECLQEGIRIQTFETYTGKERFYYGNVKVLKINKIKRFLVIELLMGWNPFNGQFTTAARFMFKVMDDFQISEYNRYLEYLKIYELPIK